MNCDERQQQTALEALGALDGPETAALRERAASDPDARAELTRFLDVAGHLGAGVPPRRPAPEVRARVMDRIRRTPQRSEGAAAAATAASAGAADAEHGGALAEGVRFLASTAPWLAGPLPGTRLKLLSLQPERDYAMLLVDLPPGTIYPEHDHAGPEEMYVLSGDLVSEGRRLGPGDFLHADGGSHHHELRSPSGCLALMVVPASTLATAMGQ